jgi:hypothetical protein
LSTTLGVGYQICGGVCQQRLVLVIKYVAEFANNAWCWLSNLRRSLPTTLVVGYQICGGGVCQQRLVLVIKSVVEFANNATPSVVGKLRHHRFDNQQQALLANSTTDLITNTKRCWQTPPPQI